MDKNNYCVIMAGGLGTRFWPMSKTAHPKQFIDVLGTGKTLIQHTYDRFVNIIPRDNIFIVTNSIYEDLVQKQLPQINASQILCEPTRRNTAPCVAYASYKIHDINPKANIIVAPSDHIILNESEFTNILESALESAKKNKWLITLGIKPSRPDTGYGYIQYNNNVKFSNDPRLRKVKTFTEKPNLEIAQTFLKSGDFLWNAGIFVWSAETILNAFQKYLPEVNKLFVDGNKYYNTDQEKDYINKAYSTCRSISIDYGIMEKADNVYVYISDFGWSDLGTWGSLYENRTKDEKGNAVVGKNVLLYDTEKCIINMSDQKLAVIQGLEDYIVVDSGNIILICKKQDEQQIRTFVNDVMIRKGEEYV